MKPLDFLEWGILPSNFFWGGRFGIFLAVEYKVESKILADNTVKLAIDLFVGHKMQST